MIHRYRSVGLALAAVVGGLGVGVMPAPGPARGANPPATQPVDINEALRVLASSPDNQATEEALAKLQAAMGQEARQVVLAQQVVLRIQENLARQLRALTGVADPEAAARVAGMLEYNAAVYRWAIAATGLPADQRDAVLAWGLKDENLPLVAKVYGRDSDAKVEAIKQLAAQEPGPATDWMMQLLLNDRDREVSLLTIDALYDRKLSTAMMDGLCDKAFGYVLAQYRQRAPQQQHTLTIHGRQVTFFDNPNQFNNNAQDADFAVDLLIKSKDPHIGEKVDNFFWELLVATGGTNMNDGRIMNVISSNYAGAQAIGRLIDAYKPKNAIVLCSKVLEGAQPNFNANTMMVNIDNQQVQMRQSMRVDAACLLIRVTGQDPADYGIMMVPNYGNRWMLKGSAAEENEMLKKLRTWLTDHAKDLATDPPGPFPETPTAPGGPRSRAGGIILP